MPPTRTPLTAALRTATAATAVTAALTACTGPSGSPGPHVSPSPSQPPSSPRQDGHLVFTLLTLRCGLAAVTGTHSEAEADGQFCAARLRISNPDAEFHTFTGMDQQLEGVSGRRGRPDSFAMAVRRQHDSVEIGGHDLIEVELWYDVPRGAHVTGLRVRGDRDPAGWMATTPAAHAPDGVLIRMPPLT